VFPSMNLSNVILFLDVEVNSYFDKGIIMKKLLISLFVLVLLVGIAGVGALYYIKPDQQLTLAYEEVNMKERALDMAKRMTPELILSGEDLNNLAKQSLAENPQVEDDIWVTGADFALEGDVLLADLNIEWKNRVSAGLQITYRLRWDNPNVIASVESARIKGISLPVSAFSDRIIPIGQKIPQLLKIKDLVWGDGEIKVQFRQPTLKELQQLIGA
jgi:hypothetical protein